jgi:hypothetical protein
MISVNWVHNHSVHNDCIPSIQQSSSLTGVLSAMPRVTRIISSFGLGLCCIAGVGCSGGVTTTDITGTVKYQGKAIVSGNVTIVASDGNMFSGDIQPDGKFSIAALPTGAAKLGVTSMNPNRAPAAVGRGASRGSATGGPKDAGGGGGAATAPAPMVTGWFPIPDTYMDPMKSNLTGTIEAGKPLDINLN